MRRGLAHRKGAYGMRRVAFLLTVMGVALILASGVALAASIACSGGECLGTEGDDSMTGTDGYDLMSGLEGNDNMFGHFGNDDMYGGSGDDFLLGDEDYDFPDTFLGNDTLYGGPGNDDLRGGFGNDKIYGGDGDDFIFAYDRLAVTTGADVVDCGLGKDTVHYDKEVDKVRGCEIKVRTTQN
jgi:Ca2+-binding RTX toxin-like protein